MSARGPEGLRPALSVLHIQTNSLRKAWLCAFSLALGLCGCGDSSDSAQVFEIGPGRKLARSEAPPRLFASSAERFGLGMPGTAQVGDFDYHVPAGWTEVAPTSSRTINLQIAANTAAECYVTLLAGDGGGDLANVNRWCGQLGHAAWNPDELAAAPRLAMLGGEAIVVILGSASSERALLGALAKVDGRSVFVKFTGPGELLFAQRAAFEAFCGSLAKKP